MELFIDRMDIPASYGSPFSPVSSSRLRPKCREPTEHSSLVMTDGTCVVDT